METEGGLIGDFRLEHITHRYIISKAVCVTVPRSFDVFKALKAKRDLRTQGSKAAFKAYKETSPF